MITLHANVCLARHIPYSVAQDCGCLQKRAGDAADVPAEVTADAVGDSLHISCSDLLSHNETVFEGFHTHASPFIDLETKQSLTFLTLLYYKLFHDITPNYQALPTAISVFVFLADTFCSLGRIVSERSFINFPPTAQREREREKERERERERLRLLVLLLS